MNGLPSNKLTRREFVGLTLGGMLLAACGGKQTRTSPIPGELISTGSTLGHLFRDGKFPEPTRTENQKIVIIGGGIAGLSAARWLRKNNMDDFVLLELENESGGNAVCGKNELTSYPWAAHYLPIPNAGSKDLMDFLEEQKILLGYSSDNLPIYEETYLCYAPHERLFINGAWQDELTPDYGLNAEDKAQMNAFFQFVSSYRNKIGSDGKSAFAIPLDESSADEEFRTLDNITFANLVKQKGWNSPYLIWYLNYCCNDDYGTSLQNTSAWAGIHYFASRKGVAANAEQGAILTWPEGNAFLAGKLKSFSSDKTYTGHAVFSMEKTEENVRIHCYDSNKKESYTILADQVICATPQFVRKRLLKNDSSTFADAVSYSPWMVANLTVTDWPQENGRPLCWDNVIYGSKSLGYVDAMHQSLRTTGNRSVLTFYYPITDVEPAEGRKLLHSLNYDQLSNMILEELKKAHYRVESSIDRMDIRVWGHAMVRPTTGYIWGNARQELKKPVGDKIFFAHSDLSGISIFEEAFHHGLRAAKELIQCKA